MIRDYVSVTLDDDCAVIRIRFPTGSGGAKTLVADLQQQLLEGQLTLIMTEVYCGVHAMPERPQ